EIQWRHPIAVGRGHLSAGAQESRRHLRIVEPRGVVQCSGSIGFGRVGVRFLGEQLDYGGSVARLGLFDETAVHDRHTDEQPGSERERYQVLRGQEHSAPSPRFNLMIIQWWMGHNRKRHSRLARLLTPFGFDFENSFDPNTRPFMILAKTNWVRL